MTDPTAPCRKCGMPAYTCGCAEPFENTLSIEELRGEVRRLWDRQLAFRLDMAGLPEVPSLATMRFLAGAAMSRAWSGNWARGKAMQQRLEGIPWNTESEAACGLWSVIRAAVLADTCPSCGGSGWADPQESSAACSDCVGSGLAAQVAPAGVGTGGEQ